MGFRFRKSINLGGGVRLNLSKKGIGLSAGFKGFRVSTGPRGSRARVSIPGTGISYEKNLSGKRTRKAPPPPSHSAPLPLDSVYRNVFFGGLLFVLFLFFVALPAFRPAKPVRVPPVAPAAYPVVTDQSLRESEAALKRAQRAYEAELKQLEKRDRQEQALLKAEQNLAPASAAVPLVNPSSPPSFRPSPGQRIQVPGTGEYGRVVGRTLDQTIVEMDDGSMMSYTDGTDHRARIVYGSEEDSSSVRPPDGAPKDVYVRGYYRKDGTYVRPHRRRSPRY